MLMYEWFKNWVAKIRFNRWEYVYFYSLPISEKALDEKNSEELLKLIKTENGGLDEKYREDILKLIKKDLGSKTIESTDYFTSFQQGETSFVLCTDKQTNPFFIPLFYEIYAYTKLKDLSKFTYNYETIIFKETKIIKFKVKCYGKK